MKQLWLFVLLLPSLIVFSACDSSMNAPDIKHNPYPKMRYEITLTIKGAPGPFESIKGYMLYKVTNEQCAPFERFAGIYRPPPAITNNHHRLPLRRLRGGSHAGVRSPFDGSSSAIGAIKDKSSRQQAEQSAFSECRSEGGRNCKLETTHSNGFAVVVTGDKLHNSSNGAVKRHLKGTT
jgi:hypothetical protein